jgi:hypothetical protein
VSDALELWERPEADKIYMIAGFRQWADAGSVSSGLPQYLIQQSNARQIGEIDGDGFYLFQIPGTHDLVRPVVKFDEGYPVSLETPRNTLYYTGDDEQGVVIFIGDEPHLDIERYTAALLDAAETLSVRRIVGLGGVHGEFPYDKERLIGGSYSLPRMKAEMGKLGVHLSDYHGGASIGSYLCRRSGEREIEYVGLYAFVPTYDFSTFAQRVSNIRLENDYMAWLGVLRRINFMCKAHFDPADLEEKSAHLIQVVTAKIDELESSSPQLGVREYIQRIADAFTETHFDPLDDVWEEELRRLLDDSASSESDSDEAS